MGTREARHGQERGLRRTDRGTRKKNILDPCLGETVKEFSTIDGAFILRGNGEIMSAGAFLRPEKAAVNLPSGLGARHAAAF
jgi:DNA integrity scanning protein DisA with diadenylate cyclase activity